MMQNTVSKISFVGDIMCEKPFLKAAKRKGQYNFDGFLAPCKELFSKSDWVIGNLETPCDPESLPTKDMFIFNAPKAFLHEIRESGIHFLTTASNHCLDRGLSGLKNTVDVLDEFGIEHTGTFKNSEEERYRIIEMKDGTRIAILSYTYGTNFMDNNVRINEEDYYTINYLTPLFEGRNKAYDSMSYSLRAKVTRMIPRGLRIHVNKMLGRAPKLSFVDKIQNGDVDEKHQSEIARVTEKAKEVADLVIVCPHFGGQFNVQPGTYVNTFADFFDKQGADLLVGNHPHVVQCYEKKDAGMHALYSLGNVSMSLSTPYVDLRELPDCSIMLHAYIQDKKIAKLSFSILVEVEEKGFIAVHPLYNLYNESSERQKKELQDKCRIIFNRVLNKNEENVPIQEEYVIVV